MGDSFQCKRTIKVDDKAYQFFNIDALPSKYDIGRLPFSLKILLENLLRHEDGQTVTSDDIESLVNWKAKEQPSVEIAFTPSRVILQDFTGVPAVVDLAAMRDAMGNLGGDPEKINPLSPVELVIDHSVMVDHFGNNEALLKNTSKEFKRNQERYSFLRWGQNAFDNFRVVPPGTGIVHQVNLEYLARVVFSKPFADNNIAYPDTLVGTDSHTTMINALGVLGWGVGGIEAEAAMLGQPVTMLIPQVVGVKITGKLIEGTTATDLVLTIVEILRKKGVVGKFVEFFGDGLDTLSLADRSTISNMAPEYGATCGMFPVDQETIEFLRLSGRDESHIKLIESYSKAQGMFRTKGSRESEYSELVIINLDDIEPSIAGPKRPQDRVSLRNSKQEFQTLLREQKLDLKKEKSLQINKHKHTIKHGSVAIAAITSCTNTSNPNVMLAAGLLAKKAIACGLITKPWVKTSLAPGSQVVTDYLKKADLMQPLETLGFNLVGYGCTTCIGNSGPLPKSISKAIEDDNIAVAAVLSGNRNFEGRIHPQVRFAYLASPPLVVAYALAGTMDIDFYEDPIGIDQKKNNIYLKDIWPSYEEIQDVVKKSLDPNMFTERYSSVFTGNDEWLGLEIPESKKYAWDKKSTYVKNPPYFDKMDKNPETIENIKQAKVLALLGDSVTTDHISPAGAITESSPAGKYLKENKILSKDFNSYGSRRGNHEVMMRGTFANIRLRNQLVPNTEGGFTIHNPTGEELTIFDCAERYKKENCPLIIIAGKEYGTGSSRDWAAKGTRLLGVKAVLVESFERIHRSNLIGMGVLPLQFKNGENAKSLGLSGKESYDIDLSNLKPQGEVTVSIAQDSKEFQALIRIDTPKEMDYFTNGGILHYVLRQLLN